ncbi:MAG: hypothetical protein V2I33_20305, partial [Kangiellaceae bacterium]|nr:hypothetical protein [Kangiellaceae bacterium]
MTTEPPRGLRANMLRLYNTITERHFNRIVDKERPKYKKLLYALCWYHSVLIERKKFRNLGFNILYSFNDSDFEVCENIIAMYLGNTEEKNIVVDTRNIPWDAIQYLIGEVSYGGRVTDDMDAKLIKVYTREFFNQAVIEETKFMLSGG